MATPKGKTITLQEIGEIMGQIPKNELSVTEKFIKGDHWQNGDGWTGWQPESRNEEAMHQFVTVQRLFNAKNVIGGMVKRIRGAALGKDPDWEIVPRNRPEEDMAPPLPEGETPALTAEEKFYKDVDKALTRWWTNKRVHDKLKDFIQNRPAYGKAALRVYIPPGFIQSKETGSTVVSAKDLDEALDKIFVEVPHFSDVIDQQDKNFGRQYTVLHLAKEKESDPEKYEICYISEEGQTILRQVTETGGTTGQMVDTELAIDLKGNLLIYVEGEYQDALISETVKQQQRSVNHAKTGENFALANINFPETTFINVELDTERKEVNGKVQDVAKPMVMGLGRWRNLIGKAYIDAMGNEHLVTPDVKWRDGADPERFSKVAENNTRDMHQEAGMLYIYLADSEYASGEARVEAMTDYLILLVDTKTLVDNVGAWLLTTVLRLAFMFSGQQAKTDQFDVIFSSNLTIGRVSVEDKRIMLDEVSKGLRSIRNYMITAEVTDDPSSELKVIRTDPKLKDAAPNQIEIEEKKAELARTMPQPTPRATGAGA